LPFLNIVQASCWVPGSAASPHSPRVPNGDEMGYLVYTTLAYGAQGISYYVYCYPKHEGGIAQADGTPTPLYRALKSLNREFVAIAKELQPLKSLGVSHAGMLPPGTEPLPKDCACTFDPPVPTRHRRRGSGHRESTIRIAHDQHRASGFSDDAFRHAADHQVFDAGAAVRSHDDEVGFVLVRMTDNLDERYPDGYVKRGPLKDRCAEFSAPFFE